MLAFWIDDLAVLYWPWVPGDEDTPGLAEDDGTGDDGGMAAAVGVVLAFVLLARFTLKGKGNPAARLASLLAVLIALWLFVAVTNHSAAGDVASAAATGTSTAITGLGHFIADVFS